MFRVSLVSLLSLFLLISCSQAPSEAELQAERVTIYRDAWGVPHIHGISDGDAAFGMAYAQAEDNFVQLEEDFIRATGRAAEVYGADLILDDWVNHALQVPALSKRDYENAPAEVKALLDGYAAGLNYYLAKNPQVHPRLITRFEPWYPLAFIRQLYYVWGFLNRLGLTGDERRAAYEAITGSTLDIEANAGFGLSELDDLARASQGSNAWAANGAKTAGEQTLLFINPHLPAFGPGQVYEAHMISDAGWNFTGYSRFGFPLPYVGFNETLGWASTDNNADQEDAWIERFDHNDDPLAYLYDGEYRTAHEWDGVINVKGENGMEEIPVRFRSTHHGPILAVRDGQFISVRLATFEEPGWLQQWYEMSKATNFEEFIEAASQLKMQFGNYTYADRAGNILQVQNGAIPVRDTQFDWNQPVDGTTSLTEWRGYHSLSQIPQVLNPLSNFVQNTNTSPYLTSDSASDPKAEDFPSYMVRSTDNMRGRNARRILNSQQDFSFEDWVRLSFDTTVMEWQINGRAYLDMIEEATSGSERLVNVLRVLSSWDGVASTSSIATTVFIEWYEEIGGLSDVVEPAEAVAVLEQVLSRLEAQWGTWQVRWGDMNRSQRTGEYQMGAPVFCDDCESLPTPGIPGWAGASHIVWSNHSGGRKRRYTLGGNSYTAVISFPSDGAEPVLSRSVHVFGSNVDPTSPNFMDQAELLGNDQYKPAWLYLEDVRAAASRHYHPGNE